MSEEKKSFSLTIPRVSALSAQTLVLALLIAVGALQTVQLYGLQRAVAGTKVRPASAATQTGGTGASQLPTMVGGC